MTPTGTPQATVVKITEPEVLHGAGDEYRILAGADETGGGYMIMHAVVPPGGGPPRHIHAREQEGFYVLAGEITFEAGDDTVRADAGTFVNIPPGLPHRFENRSDAQAEMLILFTPGGIEAFFRALGAKNKDGTPDRETLKELSAEYGITLL